MQHRFFGANIMAVNTFEALFFTEGWSIHTAVFAIDLLQLLQKSRKVTRKTMIFIIQHTLLPDNNEFIVAAYQMLAKQDSLSYAEDISQFAQINSADKLLQVNKTVGCQGKT
jgi:hypothetical protein